MGDDDTHGVATRQESVSGDRRAGWWPSPWTAAQVAAGKVSRGDLQVDRGRVYWTESRPDEGGRQVVVAVDPVGERAPTPVDVSPPGVSVRSRVHEYGGAAATVADGVLYYVDQSDQDWYRVDLAATGAPERLTSTDAALVRYADGRTLPGGRWLVSVEERVAGTTTVHRVVAVPTDGSAAAVALVDHGGFVSAPRPSPDGRWLAWCAWDHPDMPWDAARLVVAPLDVGPDGPRLGPSVEVAGGHGVAVGQPRWTVDGGLAFVDDRTGWWLPYRVPARTFAGTGPGHIEGPVVSAPLVDPGTEAEFHGPDWVLGLHTFDECPDGSLVARAGSGGRDRLVVLRPPATGPDAGPWAWAEVDQPCVSLAGVVCPDGGTAVVRGTTPTEAHAVVAVTLDGSIPPRWLSAPPAVATASERASRPVPRTARAGDHRVPGLFFPPTSPDVSVDDAELPPLVVFCHGGPTGAAEPGYDPTVQFLTSRGIAVAAVDYRGSTGYGRAYRDLLRGAWGAGDVDDCVAFARSLAADGLVDGTRLAIRGTSAGGLTALAALIRSRVFAGAVAWYGVTDLGALARDTHDFESRYMDGLVGPLPEAADLYRDRSPVHRAADLEGRVLLLQGAEDPIVPLDQAERFAERLRGGGAEVELIVFDGESHGFRRAETIEAALEAELGFYRRLFHGDAVDRA
jgi:dipeptidyl aminopeptidase/acylaminoacyl peptidase